MIITGLDNIMVRVEQAKYHGKRSPNYVRGTRKDLWLSGTRRDREQRRIRELEREIEDMKRRESEERASHQMHLAMGCDDRGCTTC